MSRFQLLVFDFQLHENLSLRTGLIHFGKKFREFLIELGLVNIVAVQYFQSVVVKETAANTPNHLQLVLHLLDVGLLEVELDCLEAEFD